MKIIIEARAEPEWDESHEDPETGLAAETQWMKNAEIRVMAENGIDTSEIQWLEWEVTGLKQLSGRLTRPKRQ
jgi:hypothetical protein